MTPRQYFKQMMWISRSFLRDLRKRKFKAMFRGMWDRHYRNDLNQMRRVIGAGEYRLIERRIQLCKINHSHAINYPAWVKVLVDRIEGWEGLYHPPPMKIIRDSRYPAHEVYMIVDGNHRLAALKKCYSPGKEVDVFEMVPVA